MRSGLRSNRLQELVGGLCLDSVWHRGEVARVLGDDDLRASLHGSGSDMAILGIVPHGRDEMLVIRDDRLGKRARHHRDEIARLWLRDLEIRDEVACSLIEDLL